MLRFESISVNNWQDASYTITVTVSGRNGPKLFSVMVDGGIEAKYFLGALELIRSAVIAEQDKEDKWPSVT